MIDPKVVPYVETRVLAPALTALAGSYVYDLRGIDRASLQLNTAFTNAGDTDVVTLSISNDGISFSAFSTPKTITFTGGTTDTGLFQLGAIDYVFLKVGYAATSAHTFTLTGVLYATGGSQVW
jgi:hypothetical protein